MIKLCVFFMYVKYTCYVAIVFFYSLKKKVLVREHLIFTYKD